MDPINELVAYKNNQQIVWVERHLWLGTLKKPLYLSLVRSHFTYCSQIRRTKFPQDILSLELIQRRATEYILPDSHSDYISRLVSLQLFPLMCDHHCMVLRHSQRLSEPP